MKHIARNLIILGIFFLSIAFTMKASDSIPLPKVYTVGLPNVPGFMGLNEDNKPEGFPIELFMYMAEQNNIKYRWVVGSWSELYAMIQKGTLDVLPGTQLSDERKEFLDFLNASIYTMWSELYVLERASFKNIYKLKGQKIGMVNGDNNGIGFDKYIRDFEIDFEKVYYQSHGELFEGLRKHEIFAAAGPSANMMENHIDNIRSTGIFYNPTSSNYAFPKGTNIELQEILNQCLDSLKNQTGSFYFKLYHHYGLASISQSAAKIPRWIIIGLYLIVPFIFIIIVFIIILRIQVRRKTVQLKHRESNLKERAIYLQEAMKVGEMGTWVILANSKHFVWSREIYNLMGMKHRNRVSLMETLRIIHPEDRKKALDTFRNSKQNMKGFDMEIRLRKPDRSYIHSKQIGVLIRGDEHSADRVLGIMHDISAQKLYENELVEAKLKAEESEQLKTAFLANMSHEIRTPLNAIIGFTELMATTKQSETNKQRYSQIILNQNKLLLKLINDIIDIAKLESGSTKLNHTKEIAVRPFMEEIYAGFTDYNKKLDFKLQLNGNPDCTILTDSVRLNQILNNLITNALKYTEEGSVELGFHLMKKSDEIIFYVKDTGMGIPEKMHDSIFERFHQVDAMQQGAGLGLPISKSLAQLLGGRIEIKSEVGQGSEFCLILPISRSF